MDEEKICLLDICPPDQGMMQRRIIQLNRDGEETWREFDIVQIFESEEEAEAYAGENGITDIEIT